MSALTCLRSLRWASVQYVLKLAIAGTTTFVSRTDPALYFAVMFFIVLVHVLLVLVYRPYRRNADNYLAMVTLVGVLVVSVVGLYVVAQVLSAHVTISDIDGQSSDAAPSSVVWMQGIAGVFNVGVCCVIAGRVWKGVVLPVLKLVMAKKR